MERNFKIIDNQQFSTFILHIYDWKLMKMILMNCNSNHHSNIKLNISAEYINRNIFIK